MTHLYLAPPPPPPEWRWDPVADDRDHLLPLHDSERWFHGWITAVTQDGETRAEARTRALAALGIDSATVDTR